MSNQIQGRMLISHNFNLSEGELPLLNRDEFAQIFINGLQAKDHIRCNMIENAHWIVEIIFSIADFSAEEIGKICDQILLDKRQAQKPDNQIMPDILFLGGKKITPAISASANSLQPGEWGVDVVETRSASIFISGLRWEEMIAQKPADSIFKIEYLGDKN
ncbi:conserved hypothetical protein [Hyella patelloides LEGE 07179]|uniref:DUF2656 domain-containing protein n=1 Tax=Hyella patelloides LEGE 07179 TaxID=945734 RepID=A0A563W3J7_9CYAN|nr:DUF2656 domain-containing protein [Hyella patelloides]VEP18133.1 conserved hypothetical protein [Hyella patelloides LEGE 07179]